jgi:hypothetical protein
VNAGSFGTLPVAGTVPTATVGLGVGEAKVYIKTGAVNIVGGVTKDVPFTVTGGAWDYKWINEVSTAIPVTDFFAGWTAGSANLSVAPLAIGSKRRLYLRTVSADGLNYNVYGIDFAGVADENSITALVLERQLVNQTIGTNAYFNSTTGTGQQIYGLTDFTGNITTGSSTQLAVANNSVAFSGLLDYANVNYKVKTLTYGGSSLVSSPTTGLAVNSSYTYANLITGINITSVFNTVRNYTVNKGTAVSKVPALLSGLSWTVVPSFVNAGSFGTLPVAGTVPTATVGLGVGEAKVYIKTGAVNIVGGVTKDVPFTVTGGAWDYKWINEVSTAIPVTDFFAGWTAGSANLSVAPLAIGSKRRLYLRTVSADGLNYNVYGIDFAGVADENSITALVLERQLVNQTIGTNAYFNSTTGTGQQIYGLTDFTGNITTGSSTQLAVANNSVAFSGLLDYANVNYKVKTTNPNTTFVLSSGASLTSPAGFGTNLYAFGGTGTGTGTLANGLSFPGSLAVTSVFNTVRNYTVNKGTAVSKVPALLSGLSWTVVPSFVNAGSFGTLPVAGTVPTATVGLGVGEAKVYIKTGAVNIVGGVTKDVPFTVTGGAWEYIWSGDVLNTGVIPAVNFFGTWTAVATNAINIGVSPLAVGNKRRLYIRTKSADGLNYNVYGIDFAGVGNSLDNLTMDRLAFSISTEANANNIFVALSKIPQVTYSLAVNGTANTLTLGTAAMPILDYDILSYKAITSPTQPVLNYGASISSPANFATTTSSLITLLNSTSSIVVRDGIRANRTYSFQKGIAAGKVAPILTGSATAANNLAVTFSGSSKIYFSPVNASPTLVPFKTSSGQDIGGYKVFKHITPLVIPNTGGVISLSPGFNANSIAGSKYYYRLLTNTSIGYALLDLFNSGATEITGNADINITNPSLGSYTLYIFTISPDKLNYNVYAIDMVQPGSSPSGFVVLYKGRVITKDASANNYAITGESTCYDPSQLQITAISTNVPVTPAPAYQVPVRSGTAGIDPDKYTFSYLGTNYTLTFNRIIRSTNAIYMICRADHLNVLEAGGCGKSFKVMNAINMASMAQEPHCRNTKFTGFFDGNNQTISNITINGNGSSWNDDVGGIFHRTDGATIKNITLDNVRLTGGTASVGGLVGWAYNTTIDGVVLKNARIFSSSGAPGLGGIVGTLEGGTLANATFTGVVQSNASAIGTLGGLVGVATSNASITNSVVNISTLSTEHLKFNGTEGYVGGLVGLLAINSSSSIDNCEVKDLFIDNGKYVGGLVGSAEGVNSIKNSSVTKNSITPILKGGLDVGGAVGWSRNTTIENVSFKGELNALDASNSTVGGLVGYAKTSIVKGSTAEGIIRTSNNAFYTTGTMGGSVAYSDWSQIVDSKAIFSEIKNGRVMGGVVGQLSASTIKNSSFYNSATRTAFTTAHPTPEIGGLVGYAVNESKIEKSFAQNFIIQAQNGAGLVGTSYMLTITDSYARDFTIQLRNSNGFQGIWAGGLLGYTHSSSSPVKLTRCYVADYRVTNAGSATPIAAAKIGYLVGYGATTGQYISLNAVYYGTVLSGSITPSGVTGGINTVTKQDTGYTRAPELISNITTVAQSNFLDTGTTTWFGMTGSVWNFNTGNWPTLK